LVFHFGVGVEVGSTVDDGDVGEAGLEEFIAVGFDEDGSPDAAYLGSK